MTTDHKRKDHDEGNLGGNDEKLCCNVGQNHFAAATADRPAAIHQALFVLNDKTEGRKTNGLRKGDRNHDAGRHKVSEGWVALAVDRRLELDGAVDHVWIDCWH